MCAGVRDRDGKSENSWDDGEPSSSFAGWCRAVAAVVLLKSITGRCDTMTEPCSAILSNSTITAAEGCLVLGKMKPSFEKNLKKVVTKTSWNLNADDWLENFTPERLTWASQLFVTVLLTQNETLMCALEKKNSAKYWFVQVSRDICSCDHKSRELGASGHAYWITRHCEVRTNWSATKRIHWPAPNCCTFQ